MSRPPRASPSAPPAPARYRSERRGESKRRTRQALIEAATELIADQGLDGPSLDAICARAGYSRGAFYVHFADREALIAAVMEQAGEQLLRALLPERADLPEVVQRFVGSVLGGTYPLAGERGVKPHQLFAACARSERLRGWYQRVTAETMGRLGSALERSQAQGLVRDDLDPAPTASVLLALVLGAQTMLELGIAIDVGQSALALLTMLSAPSPGGQAPADGGEAPARDSRTEASKPGRTRKFSRLDFFLIDGSGGGKA